MQVAVSSNKIDPFDGFPSKVIADAGEVFEKTGNTRDGRPVYCKEGDFDKACRSINDDLLYVVTAAQEMVPRRDYRTLASHL